MMNDTLGISQWNVRGLEDPNRIKRLKTWLTRTKNEGSILFLQELKIKREKLKFQLGTINPDATNIIDAPKGGKVEEAIVVPKEYQVITHDTKGDGSFAWVKIRTSRGELGIGSVYAPNDRAGRILLWKWLATNLEGKNWVLCGDWNMTNLYDDAIGPSAFIHGLELREWNRLVDKMDMVDNYVCVGLRLGYQFTRQTRKTDRYNQSRLDRNYNS